MKKYYVFNKVLLDTFYGKKAIEKVFGKSGTRYTVIPEAKRNGIYEDQFFIVGIKS